MIRNHCSDSALATRSENNEVATDESLNLRCRERRESHGKRSNVTLQLHPQSELPQQFIINPKEEDQSSGSTLDILSSEANSGCEDTGELEDKEFLPLSPENYPNCVVENEYSCSSNQTTKDVAMADLICNSDSSNPAQEIVKTEEFMMPSDEPYSYLQGLNSDNLMQFSQQSAIQELMLKEQLDAKPNLDILPTFGEHDIGGYKFDIRICSNRKPKQHWVYSSKRKKLYIRMNDVFTVDAAYEPKLPLQQLRVRALICFKNHASEPILRCQNHLSKDTEPNQQIRESILRCENPSIEYWGTSAGKSIYDRHSILIPLGLCDSSIGQPIAIKFTCQNSCIGRKETSLLFLLEGMSGEILAQRVIDVKICSCPKRDHEADERNARSKLKRKSSEDMKSPAAKEIKIEDDRSRHSLPMEEEDTCSDWGNSDSGISAAQDVDLKLMPTGKYRLLIELDKDVMNETVQSINQVVALKILDEPKKAKHYNKIRRQLKRCREKLQKV